ncbi:flagellar basal body P-ring protein FlgI [Candidatus Latescibacterota bacterium]
MRTKQGKLRTVRECYRTSLITLGVMLMLISSVSAEVRLKDVVLIKDQREIQLKGLGLVTGLNGTGDTKTTQFTIRMIGNMMKNFGLDVPSSSIKVKNVAAVMVTATISPYIKVGGTFDVTVSSMGDAKSIEDGTLQEVQLFDSNGLLYGKVQGSISIGGANKDYSGGGGVINNATLVGVVPGGGILEREIPTLGMEEHTLTVTLRNPDYTTAYRLATAINDFFMLNLAVSRDAGSIMVNVPDEYVANGEIVKFISEMEAITFNPDERARVVINERTGTIVAGSNVTLSPVAIMHGALSLVIGQQQTPAAVPALPVVQGQTGDRMVSFGESVNVSQVAGTLNMLGVTPRDLIAIFQALKESGSLRAELVIM